MNLIKRAERYYNELPPHAKERKGGMYVKELIDELNTKTKQIEDLQAKIDLLMLEYCPDEMTKELIEDWEKHQVKSDIEI